jgi:hypothetical protein
VGLTKQQCLEGCDLHVGFLPVTLPKTIYSVVQCRVFSPQSMLFLLCGMQFMYTFAACSLSTIRGGGGERGGGRGEGGTGLWYSISIHSQQWSISE